MATQTAIDYAGRRVRLLEFDGTVRKIRVVGVQEVDLDVGPQGLPGVARTPTTCARRPSRRR